MDPARGSGFALALVCSAALLACKKPAPSAATRPARVTASAAPAPRGGSRLASPTAFELAQGARGAALVWAPYGADRPTLVRAELDPSGVRRGSASALLDASARGGAIEDLAAAWVEERLAVAWIERSGDKARVRAAWAEPKARVFELGAAWRGPPTARGNVVLAARRGAALVFARGDEVRCVEPGRHACYAFGFHELAADHVGPTGLPLTVPVPCTDNATSLVVLDGRYHYGVCTDNGSGPVTTMFTITVEPAYARADPVLEGCEPLGTFVWRGNAWLVAECQGNRRAARLGGGDEPLEYLDLRSLSLDCRDGTARLHAAGFDLPLAEPRARLESLLPVALAPRGARAVWTGRALLVASSVGSALRVARYVCERDRWDESSVDLE